jgi:hypothetical protein
VKVYWVNEVGQRALLAEGVVNEYGDISFIVGPGTFVPWNYGEYQTDDPSFPTISVWGRFQAEIGEIVVQDVIIKSCSVHCQAESYVIGADSINQSARPSSGPIYWAWPLEEAS